MHSVFLYHAIQVPKCLLLLSPLQLSCVGCLYIEAVIGKQLALFTSSVRYRGNACIHLCAGWDGYVNAGALPIYDDIEPELRQLCEVSAKFGNDLPCTW